MFATMDSKPTFSAEEPYVLDTGALRALAHPLRVEIYDLLSQYGPQTSSSLAEKTGESSGSTSYHLRALAKHGLIRDMPGKGTGRERWWERVHNSVTLTNPDAMRSPAGRAASQMVNLAFIDRRHHQLRELLAAALRDESGELNENLSINTATTNLTLEQLKELQSELAAVLDSYTEKYRDQTGEGVRRISIQTSTLPLDERPQ